MFFTCNISLLRAIPATTDKNGADRTQTDYRQGNIVMVFRFSAVGRSRPFQTVRPRSLLQIRRQYKGRPAVLMLFTLSFSLIRPNWPHESGGFRGITPGLSPRRSCKLGGKIRAASLLGAVRGVNGYERC